MKWKRVRKDVVPPAPPTLGLAEAIKADKLFNGDPEKLAAVGEFARVVLGYQVAVQEEAGKEVNRLSVIIDRRDKDVMANNVRISLLLKDNEAMEKANVTSLAEQAEIQRIAEPFVENKG